MQRLHSSHSISVVPYAELRASPVLDDELNAIFYEASSVQSFANEELRTSFRDRWLGRYLRLYDSHAFVAVDGQGAIAGYVVGALADPAETPLFADIGYFAELVHLTRCYPAHLHVNVAAGQRSSGIGARLVERFARHARAQGAPGVHVVTAHGARNVAFYERAGFRLVGRFSHGGKDLVFLGRQLVQEGG